MMIIKTSLLNSTSRFKTAQHVRACRRENQNMYDISPYALLPRWFIAQRTAPAFPIIKNQIF